nr:arylesterase [Methylocapsa acidiphila]
MLAAALLSSPARAAEDGGAVKLVAFGDSLSAGYNLPAEEAFPAVLEAALRKEGYHVDVTNAGVSGDTASDGLARVGWSLADGADAVILELGANDMLRGLDPEVARGALDAILQELRTRKIPVLIAGMKATPSLGKEFKERFDPIFPQLAEKYDALLYPFFLDGVMGDPSLTLKDGVHPNKAGVERIVAGILPSVRALLDRLGQKAATTR